MWFERLVRMEREKYVRNGWGSGRFEMSREVEKFSLNCYNQGGS